jgi:peptide/nickel transport system substrate-binding protein
MAALHAGEIDWWELPPGDLVEQLARDRNVTVVSQYATAIGILRFNHLYPPFDNPAVRLALLGAVDQAEAMTAVAGTDHAFWHDGMGLFATGTPFANSAGIEVLRTPRDYPGVKRALTQAGYKGERIVVIAPTDVPPIRALTLAGAEQLRRVGINVDLQEMDFGTVVRRRASQRLERVLYALRQVDPEHQPLWQHVDTRRWPRRLRRLADEPPHRSLPDCLAGGQQY